VPGADIHRAGAGGAAHPDGGERVEAHRGFQDLEDVAGSRRALGGPLGRFMEIPLSPPLKLVKNFSRLTGSRLWLPGPRFAPRSRVSARILCGSVDRRALRGEAKPNQTKTPLFPLFYLFSKGINFMQSLKLQLPCLTTKANHINSSGWEGLTSKGFFSGLYKMTVGVLS